MADVVVVADNAAIRRFMRDPGGPVVRRLIVDGEKVKQAAIRYAPKRPGSNMANHIVKRLVTHNGSPAVIVGIDGSAVPYAIYVHEGTGPHLIYPRLKPRLVFFSQRAGKVIYMPVGRPVHHPGNRPNRFLLRALRALRG